MKKWKEETERKINDLNEMLQNLEDEVFKKKVLMVKLKLEGLSVKEISERLECSKTVIYSNIKRYEKYGGVKGLYIKKQISPMRKLTEEQEKELYEIIKTKLPNEVGFAPSVKWTSSLAVRFVDAKYGVRFSIRGMNGLFERIGLRKRWR